MVVEVKMKRGGLQNPIKKRYEIPAAQNGSPYSGGKMSLYSLDTKILELKVIKGSYQDLYVVIK